MDPTSLPRFLVVMGVSGSGKTTVGRLLAERLGGRFFDADDFHPAANRRKMAAGEPLTDADRRPWLEELARLRDRVLARGERAVLACSALKRSYRETLRRGALREVAFVHLTGPRQVLAERLDGRTGHFMPADLLDSQLAILETPEEALTIDVTDPPPVLVERIVAALESTAPGG